MSSARSLTNVYRSVWGSASQTMASRSEIRLRRRLSSSDARVIGPFPLSVPRARTVRREDGRCFLAGQRAFGPSPGANGAARRDHRCPPDGRTVRRLAAGGGTLPEVAETGGERVDRSAPADSKGARDESGYGRSG